MKEPTMLYKYPGDCQLQDGKYEYLIVDAINVKDHLADGWSLTPAEAKALTESLDVTPKSKKKS